MKNRVILLTSLLLLACSQQPESTDSGDPPICSEGGTHTAVLSSACIAGIAKQVVGKQSTFFILNLDDQKNLFIQGATLPDGGIILEIPGPIYAQIDRHIIKELVGMGFRPSQASGNFAMTVPASLTRGSLLQELILTATGKLGFSPGAAIDYEVALLAMPDKQL